MNACHRNRKRIALLAVKALKEPDAVKLRNHLDQCQGCREYWHELVGICAEHETAARDLPDVVPGFRFHDQLVRRIHDNESNTVSAVVARFLRHCLSGWKVAISVGAVAVVVLVCWQRSTTQHIISRPISVASTTPSAATTRDLPPTFSAYRTTANRSLEALDDLLTRQGSRKPWSPEVLKASVIGSGQLGD